jgi:cardiolipin-specific phospholipase
MSTAEVPQLGPKKSEFNDGRVQPNYSWSNSFKDWVKQAVLSKYSDKRVEENLLSLLPFYPESDGTRVARLIDTPIGDGNYIHEFYIENTETPLDTTAEVKDVVLVHGYAASLGLFIDNFDGLSRVPGIKIHAIDLLGFGFLSRPSFPHFAAKTKADIYKVEDWFIDSFEQWRKNRNLDKFVLMGHSFGGYLSCAYVLKYNQNLIDAATGRSLNPVDKLVLISPVGLERNHFLLLKESVPALVRPVEGSYAPTSESALQKRQHELAKEVNLDQEQIVDPSASSISSSTSASSAAPDLNSTSATEKLENEFANDNATRGQKLFRYLWRKNYLPFGIVRNLGPIKSKFIAQWTTHRFAHVYYTDPHKFFAMHDYIYRIFNGKGSGEYAITRILDVGALPKLPLLDRCPEKFAKMNLPTLWLYGDKDWMNEKAGYEMTVEINKLAGKKLASFAILPNSGHHLYLDNPQAFSKSIFKFLNFRR